MLRLGPGRGDIIELQQALTPPDASLQDRSFQEMSMVEEIAGILTISSAAAGLLLNAPATGSTGNRHGRRDEIVEIGKVSNLAQLCPKHHDWEPPHWPHQLQTVPGDPPRGDLDFIRTGYSLGEEGIARFLRAQGG